MSSVSVMPLADSAVLVVFAGLGAAPVVDSIESKGFSEVQQNFSGLLTVEREDCQLWLLLHYR
jgi:hypothetical protein